MNPSKFLARLNNQPPEDFSDEIIEGRVILEGVLAHKKRIIKTEFKNEIFSNGYTIQSELIFESCIFSEETAEFCVQFELIQGRVLWFSNCIFKGPIVFDRLFIDTIRFDGCIFEKEIRIKSGAASVMSS